LIICYLSLLSK